MVRNFSIRISLITVILTLAGVGVKAQKSQLLIAKNAVGKLNNALNIDKKPDDVPKILKEGMDAADKAVSDKKTKRYADTWALKAYLYSVAAVSPGMPKDRNMYLTTAVAAVDSAKERDRYDDNSGLNEAAIQNIIIAKKAAANELYRNKKYGEAFKQLNGLASAYKQDSILALNAAIAAQQAKQSDEAIALYSGLSNVPGIQEILVLNNAELLAGRGDVDSALRVINTDRIDKKSVSLKYKLQHVNFLIKKGQYENAAEILRSILSDQREEYDYKNLYLLYGNIMQTRLHKLDEARQAYDDALKLDSKYWEAYFQRAVNALEQGNSLLENKPADAAGFNTWVNAAQKDLQAALNINPNYKDAVKLMLEIYMRKNDFDKVQEFKKKLAAIK